MKKEKLKELEKNNLIEEINQLKLDLSGSYENLNLAKEADLLDYYAYKIKSQEAMYKYLLDEFKKL